MDVFSGLRGDRHDRHSLGGVELMPVPLRDNDHHASSHRKRLWARIRHNSERGGTVKNVDDFVTLLMPFPLAYARKAPAEDTAVTVGCQGGKRGFFLRLCGIFAAIVQEG